jgi:hypothetical protein
MIRVRFPNGQCITYNGATWAERNPSGYTDLYEGPEKKVWFAQVPTALCVVERIAPCSVENALEASALKRATAYVESLSGSTPGQDDEYLIRLKQKLADYNIARRRFVR